MDDRLNKLEQDVKIIRERNARVEADKAWEQSKTRLLSILAITYIVACFALFAIGNGNPLRNAFIPTLGFFLSMQSLPFLKKKWIAKYGK